MCGIFGVIGNSSNFDGVRKTLSALHFLEYRGYDSAGVAVRNGGISVVKTVGRVSALEGKLPEGFSGNIAIGHTRWATHGEVCDANAHPFLSADGTFAICHNGILENYRELRTRLQTQGYAFSSTTDSEVIAHLLQQNFDGSVLQSLLRTYNELNGAFAVLVENTHDNKLYALKNKSPLVVGLGSDGVYLCSDVRCVACYADKVAVVPDGTVVEVSGSQVKFWNCSGEACKVDYFKVDQTPLASQNCNDLMLKEIFEIPKCVRNAKEGYFSSGGLNLKKSFVRKIRRLYFLGCGTAYNSGLETCAVARNFLNLDLIPVVASEFIYDNYPVDENTLAFCISQSGETADTIRAAEKVTQLGGVAYAVTNTDVSSLCFVCQKTKNVFAGGEFAVASTKAYNSQLVTLLLLTLDLALARGDVSTDFVESVSQVLDRLPIEIDGILQRDHEIADIAQKIKGSSAVFFVGRALDFPTAVEGSLKLKEISYIHSEAYPSGELKHGTLALMEEGVTVVVLSTSPRLLEKNNSTANEIMSRQASVLTISPYKGTGIQFTLPTVHSLLYGIVSVVPLQLLAYHVAKSLGRDVDKPRNLAKSVTVE